MIATVSHIAFPVAAYFVVSLSGLFGKDSADSFAEALTWLPANIAVLAAPHLIFLALGALGRAPRAIVHAGLTGANLALVGVYAYIYLSASAHSGNIWLLYWPAAAICALVCAFIVQGWRKVRTTRHA